MVKKPQKKSESFLVRMTPKEKEVIEQTAKRLGMSISAYFRTMALLNSDHFLDLDKKESDSDA